MRCAVYGCCVNNNHNSKNKTENEDISYHSFPKQSKLCKVWVSLCRRRDEFNTKTARVCSKHFESIDFLPLKPLYEQYGIALKRRRLKEDAVPSLLLPVSMDTNESTALEDTPLICKEEPIDEEDIKQDAHYNIVMTTKKVDCSTQTEAEHLRMTKSCGTQTKEVTPKYSQLLKQIAELKASNLLQQKIINSQIKELERLEKRSNGPSDNNLTKRRKLTKRAE